MSRRNSTQRFYALRWFILERDNFTCQYCGQKAPNVKLEVDHKIPVSEGGDDAPENLITSCYACNRGKSGLSIQMKRKGVPAKRNGVLIWQQPSYTPTKDKICDLLRAYPEGLRVVEIAEKMNRRVSVMRVELSRLHKVDRIESNGRGRWLCLC